VRKGQQNKERKKQEGNRIQKEMNRKNNEFEKKMKNRNKNGDEDKEGVREGESGN
jgi:hypothetical protein